MLQIILFNGRSKLWSADCIHICLTKFKLKKMELHNICVELWVSTLRRSKDMEEKKKKKEKREIGRRASNSNVGINTGTSAKTLKAPVLTSNLNKAEELLRTQFWKMKTCLYSGMWDIVPWSTTGVSNTIPVLRITCACQQSRNSSYSTQQPHLHPQKALLSQHLTAGCTKWSQLHIQGKI